MEAWEIALLMFTATVCVAIIVLIVAAIREAGRKARTGEPRAPHRGISADAQRDINEGIAQTRQWGRND